jgi:hypothetical protein
VNSLEKTKKQKGKQKQISANSSKFKQIQANSSKSEFKRFQAKAKVNSNVPNMNANRDTICKNEKNQNVYIKVFLRLVYIWVYFILQCFCQRIQANSSEF